MVAWTQRSGSKNLRDYIVALLSEEGRRTNSTRELIDGLSKEQIKESKKPNKGVMMSKAGRRLVLDNVRKGRDNKSKASKRHSDTKPRPPKRRPPKRKAPKEFDDDVDAENVHYTQRWETQNLVDPACEDSNLATYGVSSTTCIQDASSTIQPGDHKNVMFPVNAARLPTLETSNQLQEGPSRPRTEHDLSDNSRYAINPFNQLTLDQVYHQMSADGIRGHDLQIEIDTELLGSNACQEANRDNLPPFVSDNQPPPARPSYIEHNPTLTGVVDPWLEIAGGIAHPHDIGAAACLSVPSLKRSHKEDETGETELGAESHHQKRTKLRSSGPQTPPSALERTTTLVSLDGTYQSAKACSISTLVSQTPSTAGQSHELPDSPGLFPNTPLQQIISSPPTSGRMKSLSSQKVTNGEDDITTTPQTTPAQVHASEVAATEDWRFKNPQTPVDAEQIDEALEVTRQNFIQLFGDEVYGGKGPQTKYYDSYARQYADLQQHSVILQPPGAKPINLDHWGAWTGGFDNWKETQISNEDFLQGAKDDDNGAGAAAGEETEDAPNINLHELFGQFTDGIL